MYSLVSAPATLVGAHLMVRGSSCLLRMQFSTGRTQVYQLDGIDPKQLHKLEKVAAEVARQALLESTPGPGIAGHLEQVQKLVGRVDERTRLPARRDESAVTQRDSSAENAYNTTTNNKFNIKLGGGSKRSRSDSDSDMSGLAQVAVAAASLTAGAVALNSLGRSVSIASTQRKQKQFLDECAGGLKVSHTVAVTTGSDEKRELAQAYIDLSDKTNDVLKRASSHRQQQIALVGTVAASALVGFAGAVFAAPVVIGLGAFGGGASVLVAAFRYGSGRTLKEKQIKDSGKIQEKLDAIANLKLLPKSADYKEVPIKVAATKH